MFRRTGTRANVSNDHIDKIQEQFHQDLCVKDKHTTVLNGRVKLDESASVDASDIQYEFHYSTSDFEKNDSYEYTFDTYPVQDIVQKDVTAQHSEEEFDPSLDTSVSEGIIQVRVIPKYTSYNSQRIPYDHGIQTDTKQKFEDSRGRGNTVLPRRKSASKRRSVTSHGYVRSSEVLEIFRKTSSLVRPSTVHGEKYTSTNNRRSVSYDPALEKASAFIHGGGKNFSRANTSLNHVKNGLKHLQMNYTETNLESNQSIIFLDLIKSSKQTMQIRHSRIQAIERRLETRRNNPLYSTTYFEHKSLPDPFLRHVKTTARSSAQKKLERKEKIKSVSDKINTGYVPTHLTMATLDREDVEAIGKQCRYLRGELHDT